MLHYQEKETNYWDYYLVNKDKIGEFKEAIKEGQLPWQPQYGMLLLSKFDHEKLREGINPPQIAKYKIN